MNVWTAWKMSGSDVTKAIEDLVEKAGANGLEIGMGFASGEFYAFAIDPVNPPLYLTDTHRGVGFALAELSAWLEEVVS